MKTVGVRLAVSPPHPKFKFCLNFDSPGKRGELNKAPRQKESPPMRAVSRKPCEVPD
jgi:hypothetical protein